MSRTFALTLLLVAALPAQEPTPPAPPTTPPAAGAPPATQDPEKPKPAADKPPAEKPPEQPLVPIPAPPLAGLLGKQYFWFGMYPDFMAKYDPVIDQVVHKVKLRHGMFWDTTLTHDRKKFLVVTDSQKTIEVVDTVSGTVLDEHTFTEKDFVLRVRDVRELPGGTHWYVRIDRVKKLIDRYAFEPSQWLLYDVAGKKIEKRLKKLPDLLDRGAQISPCGAFWHAYDDDGDLVIHDARTFAEVGRVDLHTPFVTGAGPIRTMGNDLLDRRDPDRYRLLFTMDDPVQKNRTNWGIVDVDVKNRAVTNVIEWGPQVSAWGLRIAYKKNIAAAMSGGFGGGGEDRKARLLLYDLTTGRKIRETYEEFRPRRSLVAISPEGDKIYIGVAGSDFEVFDGNLQRLKNVELEGEIWGQIHTLDG
ncbi:MAG: hypothetical protein IPK26_15930 [Planctomycetes bacterium]|nr:hypothetical protein [Planctomycetota bacterium]